MITVEQLFGPFYDHPDATDERHENGRKLVYAVNQLEAMALEDGVEFPVHERHVDGVYAYDGKDNVSGERYGGFRPQSCSQGAPNSFHKEAMAVDRWDPKDEIDTWCMKNLDKLELCGIYIEHPDSTKGWSHWTIRAPKSGRRVFYP